MAASAVSQTFKQTRKLSCSSWYRTLNLETLTSKSQFRIDNSKLNSTAALLWMKEMFR